MVEPIRWKDVFALYSKLAKPPAKYFMRQAMWDTMYAAGTESDRKMFDVGMHRGWVIITEYAPENTIIRYDP